MNEEIILQFRKELQNLGYCKTVINSYPKQIAKFLKYTRKENLEVQTKDILDYYSYLKTIISPRTKKPLSDNYLHTILLSIKLYFDYLQRIGIIKINPYQLKIKAPKSEERKADREARKNEMKAEREEFLKLLTPEQKETLKNKMAENRKDGFKRGDRKDRQFKRRDMDRKPVEKKAEETVNVESSNS